MNTRRGVLWVGAALALSPLMNACSVMAQTPTQTPAALPSVKHVLLISVDGMHASDLQTYVSSHPASEMAKLSAQGLTYTQAHTPSPSDSFPGMLALVTGGTPKSTGVYYDDSYDRALSAPGSTCTVRGTEVVYDESIDKNPDALDAGGGIDAAKLPRDPANSCAPVYPHSFLRVNTVFEVARKAGMHTAWADKHPAYDLLQGPSGTGIDDLYAPEINNASNPTASEQATAAYDEIKVQAVLNEIGGRSSSGATATVPAIFGMNFQALSVAQKTTGYTAGNVPGADVAAALSYVDGALARMKTALDGAGLSSSTLIVLSAKHGQSPIDRSRLKIVDSKALASALSAAAPAGVAQLTADDVGLVWLKDSTQAAAAAAALSTPDSKAALSVGSVLSGDALKAQFGDPAQDSRVPDLVVIPQPGVIYTKPTATKIAEHGGFSDDDTHVALLLSAGSLKGASLSTRVSTAQVAPTLLQALGLNPQDLQAVQKEGTAALPVK